MAAKLFVLHPILSTILFYALSVLFLMPSARGKVATVGGSKGWTDFDLSTSSAPNYQAWASSQNIFPGDSVVFKYTPSFHNVYSLPNKLAFDNCNFALATVLDGGASGTFTWVAPSQAGLYYFACSKSIEGQASHCTAGQKIAITVAPAPNSLKGVAASSPVPAPEASTPLASPHSPSVSPSHSHPISAPTPLASHSHSTPAPSPVTSHSHSTSAPPPVTFPHAGSPHSPLPAPAHPPSIPSIVTPIVSPAPRVPIHSPSPAPAAHSITPAAPRSSSHSSIPSPSTPPTLPPPHSHTPLPTPSIPSPSTPPTLPPPHSHTPLPTPSIPVYPPAYVASTPTSPAHTPTTTTSLPPPIPSKAPEYVPASPVFQPAASPELAPVAVVSPFAPVTDSPESFPADSPGPDGSQKKSAGTQITQHWWSAIFLAWAVFSLTQSGAAWL